MTAASAAAAVAAAAAWAWAWASRTCCACGCRQVLTLAHFPAHPEPFLTQKSPSTPPHAP